MIAEKNSLPVVTKHFRKNYLGLVVIDYHVEDRRPDVTAEVFPGKYKHFLTVRVLWNEYNWTFRTSDEYEYLPFCKDKSQ